MNQEQLKHLKNILEKAFDQVSQAIEYTGDAADETANESDDFGEDINNKLYDLIDDLEKTQGTIQDLIDSIDDEIQE